ncbi:MAG: hypothetical protein JNJ58_04355 [Chitinophagaceae bacterium]|nr:hypothetical protein [Chitinophagaceae bacterium]
MRLFLFAIIFSTFIQTFAQEHLPCVPRSKFQTAWSYLGPVNDAEQLSEQHFGAITAISVNPKDSNEIYVGGMTAGLFHTTDRGQHWTCLTDAFPYPILGINKIIVDYTKSPHTLILATGSHNAWYDAANFGILMSNDNGLNWRHRLKENNELFVSTAIMDIQIDTLHDVWYASTKNSIYRSTDLGEQWELIFSQKQFESQLYSKELMITAMLLNRDAEKLYISTRDFYILNDKKDSVLSESDFLELQGCRKPIGQQSLIKHTKELSRYYHPLKDQSYNIRISRGLNETLLVDKMYEGSPEHALYRYDCKSGKILSCIAPNQKYLGEDTYWLTGMIQHPKNPERLYLAGTVLYTSVDSGLHFSQRYGYGFGENHSPHADIRSFELVKASDDGEHDEIYLGTDGGLSYSNNSGKSFRNLNGPSLPITQFYGLGVSPFTGVISAGAQDNSIMSYDPVQDEWIVSIRGDGYDVAYSKLFPFLVYGEYNSRQLAYSEKDKAPLNQFCTLGPRDGASNKKNLQAHSNGNMYFADHEFHILRKKTSQWENYPLPISHQALAFAVSESDDQIVYLSSYWNGLYKSKDGGKTFENISFKVNWQQQNFSETRIHSICVSPDDADKVWISLGYLGDYYQACKPSKRILFSEDGGETWTDYSEGLPVYYVSDICFLEGSSEALFAATFEGIYFRENRNDTWKLYGSSFPKTIITEMEISYCRGKLLASTYGRGLWECDLPTIQYDAPYVIKKDFELRTDAEDEALYITRDMELKKNAVLNISCVVHMAKGKKIIVKDTNQVRFTGKGKIDNLCGENWGGIEVK